MFAQVFGGFDVAAEDDGVKAFLQPLFEDDCGGVEFAVGMDVGEGFEARGEGLQLRALVVGPAGLFEDLSGRVVAFEAEIEVANGVVPVLTGSGVGIRRGLY
jgi:hypothetical protein